MIKEGSKVKFNYTLSIEGEQIEKSDEPLSYTHGDGEIIPGLEQQLAGLKPGDTRQVQVSPEQGYGAYTEENVHAVEKAAFQDVDNLKVGAMVSGEADGRQFQARVTEIGDEAITLDFNHPLAGKTLEFQIEIVDVD